MVSLSVINCCNGRRLLVKMIIFWAVVVAGSALVGHVGGLSVFGPVVEDGQELLEAPVGDGTADPFFGFSDDAKVLLEVPSGSFWDDPGSQTLRSENRRRRDIPRRAPDPLGEPVVDRTGAGGRGIAGGQNFAELVREDPGTGGFKGGKALAFKREEEEEKEDPARQ